MKRLTITLLVALLVLGCSTRPTSSGNVVECRTVPLTEAEAALLAGIVESVFELHDSGAFLQLRDGTCLCVNPPSVGWAKDFIEASGLADSVDRFVE